MIPLKHYPVYLEHIRLSKYADIKPTLLPLCNRRFQDIENIDDVPSFSWVSNHTSGGASSGNELSTDDDAYLCVLVPKHLCAESDPHAIALAAFNDTIAGLRASQ